QQVVPLPDSEAVWFAVQKDFAKHFQPPVGIAAASRESPATTVSALKLPATAPQWVNQQLDSEATSPPKDNALMAKNAAEEEAAAKLRTKIDELQIGDSTLGAATKVDPRLKKTIDSAVSKATKSHIDYRSDRSAKVKLSVDLRSLWDRIRESQ